MKEERYHGWHNDQKQLVPGNNVSNLCILCVYKRSVLLCIVELEYICHYMELWISLGFFKLKILGKVGDQWRDSPGGIYLPAHRNKTVWLSNAQLIANLALRLLGY